jgi:hypothetical protein
MPACKINQNLGNCYTGSVFSSLLSVVAAKVRSTVCGVMSCDIMLWVMAARRCISCRIIDHSLRVLLMHPPLSSEFVTPPYSFTCRHIISSVSVILSAMTHRYQT